MSVGTTAPTQPAADSPPIDEALRESLAREFRVSPWRVEAIYHEELLQNRVLTPKQSAFIPPSSARSPNPPDR